MMLRFFPHFLVFTILASCNKGGDEKILHFECEEQFQGEACFKLGAKREGDEALRFFRMGCEKQSSKSCIALAEKTPDQAEASKALKKACEWKNQVACSKLGQP